MADGSRTPADRSRTKAGRSGRAAAHRHGSPARRRADQWINGLNRLPITVVPVRVSFVSDIHGNIDGLARVAEHAEQLVILGDLLDYVDYHEHGNGILGQVFGAEKVRHFAGLRATGSFGALHDYNRQLWDSLSDAAGVLADVVATRYREVLAAVGPEALLILGNVDVAAGWEESAGSVLPNRDGQVVEVAGRRFGFVAGGSSRPGTPWRAPEHVWRRWSGRPPSSRRSPLRSAR